MTKIELMISRVSQWPATRNKMKKRNLLGLSVIVACGLALLPGSDVSQQKSLKDQLIGTWTLVSVVEVYQDGRKENPWGPAVKGAVSTFSSQVDGLVERLERQADALRSMLSAYSQRETELGQLVDGLARMRAFPTQMPSTAL